MKKYTHYFTLMYTVQSDDEEAGDIAPEMHVTRIVKRITNLYENNEIIEAAGVPETEEN